jgi:hypothetical protein
MLTQAYAKQLQQSDPTNSVHAKPIHLLANPSLCVFTCSWSTNWGLGGTFKMAYGSAYIMQPDYTFAVQFTMTDFAGRTLQVKQRLKQATLVYDAGAHGCVLYTPKQPLRLVTLADDLATLAVTSSIVTSLRRADILAELVASNLASKQSSSLRLLSSASKGPFRLCRKIAGLLMEVVPPQMPSPSPHASPSPSPAPPPSPSPVLPQPSPSPSPSPGEYKR